MVNFVSPKPFFMKSPFLLVISLFILTNISPLNAQNSSPWDGSQFRKGQFFISWGYNRAQYSPSDIHLWGPGYDFTLYDVLSSDRPENFATRTYLNPAHLAIPQYNFKMGYYLTEKISVSILDDHMKYVMRNWQAVRMTGNIDTTASEIYAGHYQDSIMVLSRQFLYFEHTNGLNLVGVEIDFLDSLWASRKHKIRLNMEMGLGAGLLVPRSDVAVFDKQGANIFHVAGFGLSGHLGLRLDLGKHFFFRFSMKAGYIGLPDIYTYADRSHGASQHFMFIQEYGQLGYCFRIKGIPRSASGKNK